MTPITMDIFIYLEWLKKEKNTLCPHASARTLSELEKSNSLSAPRNEGSTPMGYVRSAAMTLSKRTQNGLFSSLPHAHALLHT